MLMQIRFLVWEYWARTYRVFGAALGIGVASCLGVYMFLDRAEYVSSDDWVVMANYCLWGLHFSAVLYGVVVLFAFSEMSDLRLSVPRYSLQLPMRVPSFVACRLVLSLVSVGAIGFFNTALYYGIFGTEMEMQLPFWRLTLLYPLLFAYVQSVAWCLGNAGPVVTALSAWFGGICLDFGASKFDVQLLVAESLHPAFYVAVLIGAFVVGCFGVAMQRRGWAFAVPSLADFLPWSMQRDLLGQRRFRSPHEAMRWYEYRRQAHILPRLAFGFFALGVLYVGLQISGEFSHLGDYPLAVRAALVGDLGMVTAFGGLVVATIASGGLFLFQNYRARYDLGREFVYIYPMSTKDLAKARFASALRAVAYAAIPLLAVGCVAYILDGGTSERMAFSGIMEHNSRAQGLVFIGLIFAAVLAAVWTGLWLMNLFAYAAICAFTIYLFRYGPWFDILHDTELVAYVSWSIAALSIGACLGVVLVAWRKQLLDWRYVGYFLAALPFVGAGAVLWLNIDAISTGNSFDFTALTNALPAVIALPLLPLATTPLAIDWVRHG